jgi:hypothetical protein
MFRYFILLAIILLNVNAFATSSANENLKKTIGKVAPAIATAGTIDYKTACATCTQIGQASKTATLYSKENNQKVDLTVLTEDEVNNVFSDVSAREDIPFGYPMDGCYARAHKMVRLMEDQGIIAGKAFVEGELYVDTKFGEVGWSYHVAPVVLVKKGGKVEPYVIDPSLFQKAVPYQAWKAKMLEKKKASLTHEYYTNRFAYDPDDKNANYTEFQEEQLMDMNQANRNFSRTLFMYNEQMKESKEKK